MRNIAEVLNEKRAELQRLQAEIELLEKASRLLGEDPGKPKATATSVKGSAAEIDLLKQFP